MGRKLGAPPPFWEGEAGSVGHHLTQSRLSPTEAYTFIPSDILIHPAIWSQQIWAENWGLCPFGEGDLLGPHLTQCGHAAPRSTSCLTCMPSFILIHPTVVWPHSTPTPQTEQDRQSETGQDRQRSRSDTIGRTVLQTVAQKPKLIGYRHWYRENRKIPRNRRKKYRKTENSDFADDDINFAHSSLNYMHFCR